MEPLESPVLSHWHKFIENFDTSSLEFYAAVGAALQRREIPGITTSEVEFREGGVMTAKRVYFRVVRDRYAFDICGAPFGNGFFFSWWLTKTNPSLRAQGCFAVILLLCLAYLILLKFDYKGCYVALAILTLSAAVTVMGIRGGWFLSDDFIIDTPYLGPVYQRLFKPATYYKEDTRLMYQEMVHAAVLEVIDSLLVGKGLRALAPEERQPEMRPLVV